MTSSDTTEQSSVIWHGHDRYQVVRLMQSLLPLLISAMCTEPQHALLLFFLQNLSIILDRTHNYISINPTPEDLDEKLTKTCEVLDVILQGELATIAAKVCMKVDVQLNLSAGAETIEEDLKTIGALTSLLEQCDQGNVIDIPFQNHGSSAKLVLACQKHWQNLFEHLSQKLPRRAPECEKGHSARIRLCGVCRGESNMGLLISECSTETWYQVYCEVKE